MTPMTPMTPSIPRTSYSTALTNIKRYFSLMFDIDDTSPYTPINDFSFYEPLPDTPSDSSSESSDIDDDPYQTSSSTPSITGGASTRINNWMAKLDLHHPFLKTYHKKPKRYYAIRRSVIKERIRQYFYFCISLMSIC